MSPGVVGVGHDMASVAASRSSTEARHATIGWRAYFERLLSDPLGNVTAVIVLLTGLGAIALVGGDVYQRWIGTSTWTLNIDGRFNAVTWFHSFVLAGASMSALVIAAATAPGDRRRAQTWLFIGLSFAFLSFDKSISFHERLGQELEETFGLADEAGRVLWQAVYAPFLAALVFVLFRIMDQDVARYRRLIVIAIGLCASKLALEALMLPAIEWGVTSEQGVLYGLEVNLEESVQLMGFGLFFATFAALMLDELARTGLSRSPS